MSVQYPILTFTTNAGSSVPFTVCNKVEIKGVVVRVVDGSVATDSPHFVPLMLKLNTDDGETWHMSLQNPYDVN